jgi:hypothetical protein
MTIPERAENLVRLPLFSSRGGSDMEHFYDIVETLTPDASGTEDDLIRAIRRGSPLELSRVH